jgi:hypothetical protein
VAVLSELLKASLIGSGAWVALLCLRPVTGRFFSQAWHYYAGLVAVAFLLGAGALARPAALLGAGLSERRAEPAGLAEMEPSQVGGTAPLRPAQSEKRPGASEALRDAGAWLQASGSEGSCFKAPGRLERFAGRGWL